MSTPYQDQINNLLDTLPLMPESQCSYFANRLSRSKVFRWEGDIPIQLFEIALSKGFRRCGDVYYQFNCANCDLCQNFRILIDEFRPTKSQRRVFRRNDDVRYVVRRPKPTAEKEEIYLQYQLEQHHGAKAGITQKYRPFERNSQLETMYYQMYMNPSCSREMEFFLNGRLIGFGIIDVALRSVSAVYFVFHPEFRKRSLGTLGILQGVEWAKLKGYTCYYLGFYIPGHPKMDYKKKFGKAEILNRDTEQWSEMVYPNSSLNATIHHQHIDICNFV